MKQYLGVIFNRRNLPLLVLISTVLSVLLMPAMNAYSRFNERQADRYAFKTIRSVQPFITSMNKLAAQNLAERTPSRWFNPAAFDAALRAGRSGIRHVPKLAELGFGCTVAGVPGASHRVPWDAPAEFSRRLAAWIEGRVRTPEADGTRRT